MFYKHRPIDRTPFIPQLEFTSLSALILRFQHLVNYLYSSLNSICSDTDEYCSARMSTLSQAFPPPPAYTEENLPDQSGRVCIPILISQLEFHSARGLSDKILGVYCDWIRCRGWLRTC